jgi:Xaa-Pro dipeptidase
MAQVDRVRLERLQAKMKTAGVDVLVCRLPENVVYLTDYWPHHGFSVAVLPKDAKPLLFLPEIETEYADPDWAEVIPFGWGLLKDGDLYENYRRLLGDAHARFRLKGARVGLERSFEVVGSTYRSAEPVVPAAPWWRLLDEVFADASQVDATDMLQTARAIKTNYELGKLGVTNEIAEMGMSEFLTNLQPGMTEIQVGAMVEHKIRTDGPGHKGARLVRALCEVGVGPIGSMKASLLVPSTKRVITAGDIVMVELATVVDGYWSDLTYVSVAGKPNERQREVHNRVLEAQEAAAERLRPGVPFSEPDKAARQVLEKAGLQEYFVHFTGHGVGLRYHEFIPLLTPGATATLETGMVSSLEPGVYIQDFGGIRIEDNVAVGADGPIFLSTRRKPW